MKFIIAGLLLALFVSLSEQQQIPIPQQEIYQIMDSTKYDRFIQQGAVKAYIEFEGLDPSGTSIFDQYTKIAQIYFIGRVNYELPEHCEADVYVSDYPNIQQSHLQIKQLKCHIKRNA